MASGENVVHIAGRNLVRNVVGSVVRNVVRNVIAACGLSLATFMLLGSLACSKSAPAPAPAAEPEKTTGLESIPVADPSKYPPLSDMSGWKNPYFVVREDGIGLVDLSNLEIHILKPEEIPAELVSLPSSAWPYGRVVLIAQAVPKDATEQTRAELRKNRALLLGTLKELAVQYREAP